MEIFPTKSPYYKTFKQTTIVCRPQWPPPIKSLGKSFRCHEVAATAATGWALWMALGFDHGVFAANQRYTDSAAVFFREKVWTHVFTEYFWVTYRSIVRFTPNSGDKAENHVYCLPEDYSTGAQILERLLLLDCMFAYHQSTQCIPKKQTNRWMSMGPMGQLVSPQQIAWQMHIFCIWLYILWLFNIAMENHHV